MGISTTVVVFLTLLFCSGNGRRFRSQEKNARAEGKRLHLDNSSHLDVAVDGTKEGLKHLQQKWFEIHQQHVNEMKGLQNVSVLFLGDSIVEHMTGKVQGKPSLRLAAAAKVFKESFTDRYHKYGRAAAFGIGGDRIPNLLWRLQNGESPARMNPRAIIVNIGTNDITYLLDRNLGNRTQLIAENVAMGVQRVLTSLKASSPKSAIILTSILPRRLTRIGNHLQEANAVERSNQLLQMVADSLGLHMADCGSCFLEKGGNDLDSSMLSDFLHPTSQGYAKWFSCLQQVLDPLML